MNSISSKGPKDSKEFLKSVTDGNNSDSTKTSTARDTLVSSNKKSRRKNRRKQNVNKVPENSDSLKTSESLNNRETIKTCEVFQSDMATELEDLKKSNKSLIKTVENLSRMMEKMTLAADKTESIKERENDCLRQKLKEANCSIAELEEDLSSSKKIWTDFEMTTAQYENKMKKKMEELENLKMNYQIIEMQWKEEITKRDEKIEMQKNEIETLRNEKADVAVQISTANRTIENNQQIDVGRAQNTDEEKKKFLVVLDGDSYNSVFDDDNVLLIHSHTDLRCISYNKASYHKELFVLTRQYLTTQYDNRADNEYFNLMSICHQWKTFYPDAEIHVIGVDWGRSHHYQPTEQIRQLWTSYNELFVSNDWTRDFTKAIAGAWSPQCYKLLSDEMKQLYLH